MEQQTYGQGKEIEDAKQQAVFLEAQKNMESDQNLRQLRTLLSSCSTK